MCCCCAQSWMPEKRLTDDVYDGSDIWTRERSRERLLTAFSCDLSRMLRWDLVELKGFAGSSHELHFKVYVSITRSQLNCRARIYVKLLSSDRLRLPRVPVRHQAEFVSWVQCSESGKTFLSSVARNSKSKKLSFRELKRIWCSVSRSRMKGISHAWSNARRLDLRRITKINSRVCYLTSWYAQSRKEKNVLEPFFHSKWHFIQFHPHLPPNEMNPRKMSRADLKSRSFKLEWCFVNI